jgi:hypothetical protein
VIIFFDHRASAPAQLSQSWPPTQTAAVGHGPSNPVSPDRRQPEARLLPMAKVGFPSLSHRSRPAQSGRRCSFVATIADDEEAPQAAIRGTGASQRPRFRGVIKHEGEERQPRS